LPDVLTQDLIIVRSGGLQDFFEMGMCSPRRLADEALLPVHKREALPFCPAYLRDCVESAAGGTCASA